MAGLEPDEQCQIWDEAVKVAGGFVPSARIVKNMALRYKGIVQPVNQQNPPSPEFAPAPGDVCLISAAKRSPLRPFDGMWGVVEHAEDERYTVRLSIAKDLQQCKAQEITRVDLELAADIITVGQRIAALIQFELEPVEYALLEVLQRSTCFTPKQMALLAFLEQQYSLG